MKSDLSKVSGLSVFKKIMLIMLVVALSIVINTSISLFQLNQTQNYLDDLGNTIYSMVLLASGNLPLLKRADELMVQSLSSGDGDLLSQARLTLDELTNNLKRLETLDPINKSTLSEIHSNVGSYLDVSLGVVKMLTIGEVDLERINADTKLKTKIFDSTNQMLNDYHGHVAKVFKGNLDSAASTGRASLIKTSLVNIVSLASLFLIIFWIARTISRSAIQVRDSLLKLSKGSGDLTRRLDVQGQDELAQVSQNFNLFIERLASIVSGIVELVPPIASASGKLDQCSLEVSNATSNLIQKARVGKSSMEEMTHSINEISASAVATSDAINATNDQATIGLSMVESTITNSGTLNCQILESSSFVNELIEDAQGVATILDLISQIAEQTNLLALNAAIEAARAGDLGRGFAVVADEVRSLSLKTADATRSIRSVLERLEKNAAKTVSSMEKATFQSSSTEKQAFETGEALRNIIERIGEVKAMGLTIASATEEQSSVVIEVTNSISEMLDATMSTEEVNLRIQCLSKELLETSGDLKAAISVFKVA